MAGVTVGSMPRVFEVERRSATPWVWLGVALGLVYLPHLVAYGMNLARLEHYQFFPLAWLGTAVLAWVHRAEIAPRAGGNWPMLGWTGAGLGMLMLAAAGVLGSSWLAIVSILPLTLGLAWLAGGWPTTRAIAPALVLFVTTIRPPGSLDAALILRLRSLAVDISGRVLDAAGIIHVPLGNVLRVASGDLFVDEACSGINSLASIVAVVLFVGLLWRRPLAHLALLVVGSAGIVLLANVVRVAVVAIALDRYRVDLLRGWKHEGLGVALYAISLGLAASLDQLIQVVGSVLSRWSPLVRSPLEPQPEPTASRRPGLAPRQLIACAATLAVVSVVLPIRWSRDVLTGEPAGMGVNLLVNRARTTLSEASLPAELAGWQRSGFTTEERPAGSPTGQYSACWEYRLGSRTARVCVDYPFTGWHELLTCYTAVGWTTGRQTLERGPLDAGPSPGSTPYVAAALDDRKGEHASLRFALVDDRGRWVSPAGREGLVLAGREVALRAGSDRPTYQIQVLDAGYRPQGAEANERCTRLFEAACRELKGRLFTAVKATP